MLTYSDKEKIKELINKTKKLKNIDGYSEFCKSIFLGTDKIGEVAKYVANKKKCLVPTSSGENSIEFATYGFDVYTYDINLLSYFTQQLRIAALLQLDYENFINYFFGNKKGILLAEPLYCDVREGLSEYAKFYFDNLYKQTSSNIIWKKIFEFPNSCEEFLYSRTFYINSVKNIFKFYNEEQFYEAKKIDLQNKIHFKQSNILDITSSDYKDEKDFDLIFFSNIFFFLNYSEKIRFIEMLKGVYSSMLNEDGVLVNYFHSMLGDERKFGNLKNHLYHTMRLDDYRMLERIVDNFYNIGTGHNNYGKYKDDVIHLMKKMD